jgi:hypothetical protein
VQPCRRVTGKIYIGGEAASVGGLFHIRSSLRDVAYWHF